MKRLWGIRHIRFWYLRVRVHQHAMMWARTGIGLGWPNEADLRQLDRIWKGEA